METEIHFGELIKGIIEGSLIPKSTFAKQVGVSETSLYKVFKKKDLNTKILRKVSTVYNVPFKDLFSTNKITGDQNINNAGNIKGDKNQNINVGGLKDCLEKVNHLQEKVTWLEKQVKDKEEIIELLKK
jgi:DNA-binding XRE family transcriptional regulator